MKSRFFRLTIDLFVLLLGSLSLLAPFIFPKTTSPMVSQSSFPIMVSLIIILCLLILFIEAQTSLLDSKMIAFMGILIATNASLRFLENAIPGPGAISPVFFLIIISGYYFGSRIGFLMGVMTMFVSGLLTGGVGPWLPGQMISAGWVGQFSALLRPAIKKLNWQGKFGEIILLGIHGAIWGILYGVIMNLWYWPFIGALPGQGWLNDCRLAINLQRYGVYYLSTSLLWDITRAVGNIVILVALTKPVLRIFDRFNRRFTFQFGFERER